MKIERNLAEIADRRLILAVEAAPLNGLAELMRTDFIKTSDLIAGGIIQDQGQPLLAICEMLADCGVWFGPRRYLENDPTWRQLIPYVVLKNEDKYLTYKRGAGIEEQRLANRMSIGWGGHIDLPDAQFTAVDELSLFQTVNMSMARELEEEVGMVGFAAGIDPLGLIISKDETGAVHVGLVVIVESASAVVSQEDSQLELTWMTAKEIVTSEGDQEGWTSIVAQHLEG